MRYVAMIGLLILALGLSGVHCQTEPPPRNDVCEDQTIVHYVCNEEPSSSVVKAKLDRLVQVFTEGSPTEIDLVFLVDLSKSLSDLGINQARESIVDMLQFLSSRGFIFKHYCFTRIAIASFEDGSLPDYSEILQTSYDRARTVSLCRLRERLRSFQWHARAVSNIDSGLKTAEDQFLQSPRKATSRKILWLFGDGDYKASKDNYEDSLRRLKSDLGVKVITSGLGSWFLCPEHERTLQSIASVPELYACAKIWKSAMDGSDYPVAEFDDFLQPRYIPDNECCGSSNGFCACDLQDFTLTCSADEVSDEPLQAKCVIPTTTQKPVTVTVKVEVTVPVSGPPVDGDREKLYILIGATVAGIVGVVLIFTGIGCVVFVAIRTKPRGPALPPPTVMNDFIRGRSGIYDNIYGTFAAVDDRPTEKQQRLYEDIEALNLRFINDLPVEESIAMGQEEVIYESRAKKQEKNEKNMKGWGVYLADLKAQYTLKHISVLSPSNRRAAWTEGFELPDKEVKQMCGIMDSFKKADSAAIYSDPDHRRLTVKGETYTMTLAEMSENHLYGYREVVGATEMETAWVVRAKKYVVVAVAPESRNTECESLVHEIFRYLTVLSENPYGEVKK